MPTLFDDATGYHQSGRLAAAEQGYLQVLAGEPGHIAALHMLGVLRAQQQRYREALDLIGAALRQEPGAAMTLANYANVLTALGRPAEALSHYDRALAIEPRDVRALNNRGNVLGTLGRHAEALSDYDAALTIAPDYAQAWNNRCAPLLELARFQDALASCERALALDSAHAEAMLNRGNALFELRRLDEALASYDRALLLRPQYAEAHCNRGIALRDMGRMDEALESLARATSVDPGYAHAHWTKSLCHLLMGDFAQGWSLYDWHRRLPAPMERRDYVQPSWSGNEDIRNKTIFLYLDEGIGDAIQFIRYAEMLQQRGAHIVLSVHNSLKRLLSGISPAIEIIDAQALPRQFDYHLSLIRLPEVFRSGWGSIPATVSYLGAEPELVRKWAKRIGNHGFRIGISWQGKNRVPLRGRSFPLSCFTAISKIPGVRLISLQKDFGTEQLRSLPPGMALETPGDDFDAGPDALIDTAAIMATLDLVITADTAIAHLAGALGRPTWIALKYSPDWRWFLGRDDSPWYPTVRLFRQQTDGNWDSVFAKMREELSAMLSHPLSRSP